MKRREYKMIFAGGGGGSAGIVEGIVDDSVCASGTLDVIVDYASSCTGLQNGDVINVVDRYGIMGGHVSSEFANLIALAFSLYDLETCTQVYRLALLNGHGECPIAYG